MDFLPLNSATLIFIALPRPLVMILEDRGVKKETFMELLESAVANTHLAQESVDHFAAVMRTHGLGAQFGLSSLLHKLSVRGFDLNSRNRGRNLRTPFIDKLISTTISTALRDIQYRCRIPVLKSHTLVGVADEGPAYIQRKEYAEDEVFALDEGDVFGTFRVPVLFIVRSAQTVSVCVQADLDSEPVYLERKCLIFRSPTIYPGDCQERLDRLFLPRLTYIDFHCRPSGQSGGLRKISFAPSVT